MTLVWAPGLVTVIPAGGGLVPEPEPAPFQADSGQPGVLDARLSDVPPTAVTYRDVAGYDAPTPLSPLLAVITTPGWLKCASSVDWPDHSEPPQLFDTYLAPSATA